MRLERAHEREHSVRRPAGSAAGDGGARADRHLVACGRVECTQKTWQTDCRPDNYAN